MGPNRLMIYANRAAQRILAGRDGLFLDGKGACRASRAAEQALLDRLIDGAIGGRWRGGGDGVLQLRGRCSSNVRLALAPSGWSSRRYRRRRSAWRLRMSQPRS